MSEMPEESLNESIDQRLEKITTKALTAIEQANDLDALEACRVAYLGSKGAFTQIMQLLRTVPKEDKPRIGALVNEQKKKIEDRLEERKAVLYEAHLSAKLSSESIDVTAPGRRVPLGHEHPLSQIRQEIISIFYSMGFSTVDGPEIETDYYNFDSLNTPANHPARDEQDTFYTNLGPHVLLRSQTSTVQVRVMEKTKPPIRVIAPGRVYRNEEVNAHKYPLFHQVEGLLIDKDVTFGQLKGTLQAFIKALFKKDLNIRFRPDFFPFTEPSAELDSQCPFCQGKGCRTCGNRGWLELLGCGMVDPNVLKEAGIDPEIYSGFAFGMGLERLAMLKYDINDIRHFYTNDLRFLEQF